MTTSSTAWLSGLLGSAVLGPDRRPLGRLVDLTVDLGGAHPGVRRAGIGARRRVTHLVPFAGLSGPRRSVLGASPLLGPGLLDHEVLLGRDVLDTQVVDLDGRRLCRVSDVVLVEQPGGALEVAAVDVGFGALLRRVGLGWWADRIAPVLVDWQDLHLTSSRGHLVQLSTATSGMRRLDAHGVAELVARLNADQAAEVLGVIDPATSAAALGASHHSHRERLLRLLPSGTLDSVTAAAPPGLRAHLLDAVGAPERRRRLRTAGWRLHPPPVPVPPAGNGHR